MRIIFLGCTKFSEVLLKALLEEKFDICAVFTIPKEFTVRGKDKVTNINYVDLDIIAQKNDIPVYTVNGKKDLLSFETVIRELKPDVILVLGWYYIVPSSIRKIPKYGACGIHASLLPRYAGWSPLVWAIINGEKETGVTFFQFDSSTDGGDIIEQKKISIEYTDTIKEVYDKATQLSKEVLLETLPVFGKIEFKKQDKSKLEVYPKRSPEDGEIDLNQPAEKIYNFIRAQSSPYPGAYIKTTDSKKIIIEKARVKS